MVFSVFLTLPPEAAPLVLVGLAAEPVKEAVSKCKIRWGRSGTEYDDELARGLVLSPANQRVAGK